MTILLKTDEDNDIYEITIDGKTYSLDTIYESPYGKLFDELNLAVDAIHVRHHKLGTNLVR
jgi:hypothetical protein